MSSNGKCYWKGKSNSGKTFQCVYYNWRRLDRPDRQKGVKPGKTNSSYCDY